MKEGTKLSVMILVFGLSLEGASSNRGNPCNFPEQYCPSGCVVNQQILEFEERIVAEIDRGEKRIQSCQHKLYETSRNSTEHRRSATLKYRSQIGRIERLKQKNDRMEGLFYQLSNRLNHQNAEIAELTMNIDSQEALVRELEATATDVHRECRNRCPDQQIEAVATAEENCPNCDGDVLTRTASQIRHTEHCGLRGADIMKDCATLYKAGYTESGIYLIQPGSVTNPFKVYCDMDTSGGGWVVIQRRVNGQLNFDRNWTEYKEGFGLTEDYCNGEFWLGNEKMMHLTSGFYQTIRFVLTNWERERRIAQYLYFRVNPETSLYMMQISVYDVNISNASDSISGRTYPYAEKRTLNNMDFTTRDSDNDRYESGNCANRRRGRDEDGASEEREENGAPGGSGGWWYNECHGANLNGIYYRGGHYNTDRSANGYDGDGIIWNAWMGTQYSLKATEMKIRPFDYSRT